MREPSFEELRPEREVAPPAPVIIKRITIAASHAHHGGAWKVAYADFVTAMMAFFLLLWIVGATNEDQRKGIADYFTPTVIQQSQSGGSNGVLAGRSIQSPDGIQPNPAHSKRAAVDPVATSGSYGRNDGPGSEGKGTRQQDDAAFRVIEQALAKRIGGDPALKGLAGQVRLVRTGDGLRIEMIDKAGFSMFGLADDRLQGPAARLLALVARSIQGLPNRITIRGHTDARAYDRDGRSNWLLSGERAEATRRALASGGIDPSRFARIEGVADREPYYPADPLDARNRRISVTLLYRNPV